MDSIRERTAPNGNNLRDAARHRWRWWGRRADDMVPSAMRRRSLLLLLLAACSEPALQAGGFRLVSGTSGFTLTGADGGVLLDGARVSTRRARARIEMQYGSFRFSEPAAPAWTEGLQARVSGDR